MTRKLYAKPVRLKYHYLETHRRIPKFCLVGGRGQGVHAILEHGIWWITLDNPPQLLQVAEGEYQQLQQTVPPALQEDGALQSKQPLSGKTENGYGLTNQGGH